MVFVGIGEKSGRNEKDFSKIQIHDHQRISFASSTLLQFITSFINYLSLIRKILHGKKLEIFALYCPNRVMGRIRKSIIISETIVH